MTTAIIAHQIPGRLRIRIPEHRGNTAYFSTLSEQLAEIEDVLSSRTNPSTGSILIQYSGDTEQLVQHLEERIPDLLIEQNHRIKSSSPIGMQPFRLVSGRRISPMFMLGTALAAIGIIQTVKGKVAVPSITAFWYAIEAFRQS